MPEIFDPYLLSSTDASECVNSVSNLRNGTITIQQFTDQLLSILHPVFNPTSATLDICKLEISITNDPTTTTWDLEVRVHQVQMA